MVAAPRRRRAAAPNSARFARPLGSRVFELQDSSTKRISALSLILGARPRDPAPHAARLAAQFASLNRALLNHVGATIEQQYDRNFGVRSDMELGTFLEQTGFTSLHELLQSDLGKK